MQLFATFLLLASVQAAAAWKVYLWESSTTCYQPKTRIITGAGNGVCNQFGQPIGNGCYDAIPTLPNQPCTNPAWRPHSARIGDGSSACQIYTGDGCTGSSTRIQGTACGTVPGNGNINSFRCWN
ncbi:hypothetical protein P154DRAFT_567315 [Amniculicola lignicola CBS 123094]|uniref:Uncharacterized protein n=1 Tax=Amniculicola lignicola CBS 123094 TaxID=1392246 RepID=A0A6A5W0N2_9PLEO|nr:hypothetical protein P154DRAFT_567315 [Amniculicola lignicola CBS 123094]